jgi:RNA polymerase sigma-70 factor (ECF subfamily)
MTRRIPAERQSMSVQAIAGAPAVVTIDAESLFRAHARFVARFCAHLRVPADAIDDHVQEVFLVAHRRGGFVPGEASATTWLARIALNVIGTRRRSFHRRREEPMDDVGESPGFAPPPDRAVEATQALERVQRALDALDVDQRALFVLFEIEGHDCADIAAGLGVPIGTVYSRLHAARAAFTKAHEKLVEVS